MSGRNRTYRLVDGERIAGSWRHVFIRNGPTYYLADLMIYADGMVDCWGLLTLDEFADKLLTGWVATEFEEGAQASAHNIGTWKLTEVRPATTADDLLAEVREEIAELNNQPTSTDLCHAALKVFLADPAEPNRAILRAAYLEIPESLRLYALGDMDAHDQPLMVLAAGPGQTIPGLPSPVSDTQYAAALRYFAERPAAVNPVDEPAPAILLEQRSHPGGWPSPPGPLALRNEYPATIRIDGLDYRTASHAYLALSTTDPAVRTAISEAKSAFAARGLITDATRRPDWHASRLALMMQAQRAKFVQHPELAEELLRTGDAPLHYSDVESPRFWGQRGDSGRNWMGRVLELIRSELQAGQLSR